MEEAADRIKRRLTALKAARQPLEAEWRDCYRYTFPERSAGLEGSLAESVAMNAKSWRADIYDDTAKDAARLLASSFASGLTPANSQWFGLDTGGQETDEEARWLSDAAQFLFDNIHAAAFDAAAFECHLDMASGPGMFVLFVDEEEEGGFRFEQWPIGQCFVAASKAGGRVDTVYREFEMTIEQLVNQYGLDKVSEGTRQKYTEAKKLDEKVRVVWAIEPRTVYDPEAKFGRNMQFASCHVELTDGTLLRESGFPEFPCCVPRWMLVPGTDYATGPMSSVLATVKSLNELKRLEFVNLEMVAFGMFKAKDDGILNPHTTTIGPRRVVVVAEMDNFEPVQRSGDFQIATMKAEELQRDIRKLLLADQLQPQDGPAMTATEVHARIMLIRQQLGPIFGRLQAEWLRPLIERCFGLALRAGALFDACGPAPESLGGKALNVTYQSPLARAQKLEEVTAIDQWAGGIALWAKETQQLEVLDEVNVTEITRFKREALGVPSIAQRKPDEVAKLRQQRAEAQKAAQQQQIQANVQEAAGTAAAERVAAA